MKKLLVSVIILLFAVSLFAGPLRLTVAQNLTLKAYIDANLSQYPNDTPGNEQIGFLLNAEASPVCWVWRTSVSRADLYNTVDWEGGTWDWTTYKNQSQGEQNAWVQMFMGDVTNFAQDNVRAGVTAIFSGSGAQATQRTHILSVGRRKATLGEKLFATGNCASATPSKIVIEGAFNYVDVEEARQQQ